ncbi:adhesion domain-containing protein [Aeromonas sanarellii]|uniref:adhesion domain-containing protein n=1 Tax=Aeromonas sanarellii TaxID=633415 RepID=UPI0039882A69
MYRRHYLKILSLVLMFGSAVGLAGAAVAADISVTSTFVPTGPLPPTCDATAGAGQGKFATPDGQYRNWSDANSYCTGQGMRMPTRDELVALYNAYPANQMDDVCGWPTTQYYWSSTVYSSGYHYMITLINGVVHGGDDDFLKLYVACVR